MERVVGVAEHPHLSQLQLVGSRVDVDVVAANTPVNDGFCVLMEVRQPFEDLLAPTLNNFEFGGLNFIQIAKLAVPDLLKQPPFIISVMKTISLSSILTQKSMQLRMFSCSTDFMRVSSWWILASSSGLIAWYSWKSSSP